MAGSSWSFCYHVWILIYHTAGAMKLTKYPEENKSLESPPFVASIQLNSTDASPRIEYPAYSYIDISQGERIVFPARKAYPGFPGGTPKGLEAFRQKELAELRV